MTVIVDYGAGNLTSVRLAFAALHEPATVSNEPAQILAARRVVFPGVGAARAAMDSLQRLGLGPALRETVARGTPFLGICLGTQIVFDRSAENDGVDGLGLIPGDVRRFLPADPFDKVPHMGWNSVRQRRPHPLMADIPDESEFYFVHSFYPVPARPEHAVGETEYAGVAFASMIATGNLVATQFHPEKSGRIGLTLLRNFCQWDGSSC
jgi:imidazole glycerol-phosphate synthase subunit HisH